MKPNLPTYQGTKKEDMECEHGQSVYASCTVCSRKEDTPEYTAIHDILIAHERSVSFGTTEDGLLKFFHKALSQARAEVREEDIKKIEKVFEEEGLIQIVSSSYKQGHLVSESMEDKFKWGMKILDMILASLKKEGLK